MPDPDLTTVTPVDEVEGEDARETEAIVALSHQALGPEDAATPAEALDGYAGAMQAWVDAVRAGRPVDGLAPVGADPTTENADHLASRLAFVERELLDGPG